MDNAPEFRIGESAAGWTTRARRRTTTSPRREGRHPIGGMGCRPSDAPIGGGGAPHRQNQEFGREGVYVASCQTADEPALRSPIYRIADPRYRPLLSAVVGPLGRWLKFPESSRDHAGLDLGDPRRKGARRQ